MRRVVLRLALVFLVTEVAHSQPLVHREDDGLLENQELRALVDAQSRRESAPLIAALESDDPLVRARAALALGSVQDSLALRPLIRRLMDSDARVRADAAFALGQLRDSTAGRPLLDALHTESDAIVIHRLHEAIGEVAGASLVRAYMDIDVDLEYAWSHALGLARIGMRDIRRSEVAGRLASYLLSMDEESRRHAAYYYWRVNDVASWSHVAAQVRSALSRQSDDDLAAGYLALALAGIGDPADLARVTGIARQSQDWRTRDRAVRAIARYDDDSASRDLVRSLDDPSHHVAETAARLLAEKQRLPDDVLDIVRNLANDGGRSVRLRGVLVQAVARHGDDAPAIRLSSDNRIDAAPALGVSDSEESLRLLLSLIRSDDVAEAGAGLAALRSRWARDRERSGLHSTYVDAITDAISGGDVAIVYGGAPLLSDPIFIRAGSPRFMQTLFETFEMPRDVEAAIAVVQAAQIIDHPDARALVAEARRHEHSAVRRAAGATSSPSPAQNLASPDWSLLAEIGERPILELTTDRGNVSIQLFADLAPATVSTIARLVIEGRYDGVPFHRVVPDFVIQGGDFARGDGFGGPGFEIPSEFTPLRYASGTVGMASAGKDTEGSQFFITHSMQPHLDGRYTAFGIVVDGQEVIDAIQIGDRILRVHIGDD